MQNINQILNSQKTLHISPSWASYGVSIVGIWEKNGRVIMALHCIRIPIVIRKSKDYLYGKLNTEHLL